MQIAKWASLKKSLIGGVCRLALILVSFTLPITVSAQTHDWRMPTSWKQDAELTDLFLIDRENGWIVGDRGLVMRTVDGGKNWQYLTMPNDGSDPNAPPISCRLESVFFASPTHGWIAGGYTNPGATTSIGVLFATVDGGNSWKRLHGIALPKINQVMFSSPLDGIAIGDGNAQKPSGVFETHDGGRSWSTSMAGGPVQSWQVGGHANGVTVMASQTGKLARYSDGQLGDSLITQADDDPHFGEDALRLRQMKMLDDRFGFAVGDNRCLIQTRNGAFSWDYVPVFDAFDVTPVDFYSLDVHGQRIWLAGNPGTQIWTRTADQPEWQALATPIQTAITKIDFVDETHGWAIGRCGDVIHTADGGQTWARQRRGTGGVALLQIGTSNRDLVPELFSKYCGDENYIGAALSLTLLEKTIRTDESGNILGRLPSNVAPPISPVVQGSAREDVSLDHARQALSRAGCAFVDDPTVRLSFFGGGLRRSGDGEFHRILVRQICALRPRVIAIPAGNGKDVHNLRGEVLSAVKAAATVAHDSQTGLKPWQVGKVVVVDRGDVASLKITPAHYMVDVGALLTDHAAVSRLLLDQPFTQSQPISLTTIFTSPYAAGANNRLFGGIENTDADVPVRKGRKRSGGNMAQMKLMASKNKTLNRMLDGSPDAANGMWNSGLSEMNLQLGEAAAGVWLFDLASRCEAAGKTELAVQTHLFLTSQIRHHPLATSSFRWLFNFYSSAEQAHITMREARLREASKIDADLPESALKTRTKQYDFGDVNVVAWQVDDPRSEDNRVQTASWTEQELKNIFRRRFQQARSVAQSFALVDPTALEGGRNELMRIGLTRRLDPLISVGEQLKRLAASTELDVSDAAMLELGIVNRRGDEKVKSEITCAAATNRPWLDGDLNEAVWQQAGQQNSVIPLANEPDDQVLITSDDEFLYLGIRCVQQIELTYGLNDGPRARDSNLEISDRMEIAIDIDRDYNSFYLFTVDSSGKVAESFGDNRAWNPKWYVASELDGAYWTAEIAIPLEEISTYGDFWSIAATRFARNQVVSSAAIRTTREKSGHAAGFKTQPSLHQAANEQRSGLQAMPLHAFRLVRMPWADQRGATSALPEDD